MTWMRDVDVVVIVVWKICGYVRSIPYFVSNSMIIENASCISRPLKWLRIHDVTTQHVKCNRTADLPTRYLEEVEIL